MGIMTLDTGQCLQTEFNKCCMHELEQLFVAMSLHYEACSPSRILQQIASIRQEKSTAKVNHAPMPMSLQQAHDVGCNIFNL